jgi:predicted transcriptional regulator
MVLHHPTISHTALGYCEDFQELRGGNLRVLVLGAQVSRERDRAVIGVMLRLGLSSPKLGVEPMKEHVAEIVAAYVGHHTVGTDQLPALIMSVTQALSSVSGAPAVPSAELVPAVPIRRSVGAETITCLDCGWKAKVLKRHLTTAHGMSVDEYRGRWGLPGDYPMVARNYAARRSELAKSSGLGRWREANQRQTTAT